MKTSAWFVMGLSLVSLSAYAAPKGNAVLIEAKDVQWQAVPGMTGIQTATVEGDATKGPHHAFMKFDSGFTAPMHHHSANHFVTVVAGTLVLTVDGQEHRLPAGSYFSFKNKGPHATSCAPGAECILFVDVRGKWDVVMSKK
jgi:quercetin dioxygenase-like cupin family protein